MTEPARAHSGSPVADSNWRDWTDSQIAEPMGLIAECFLADDVADYLRFRASGSAWHIPLPHRGRVWEARKLPRRSGLNNLAVSGAGLVDDSTVALYLGWSSLVTAKPGDERWTPWHCKDGEAIIAALAFAGCFYCITEKCITVVDGMPEEMLPYLTMAAELGDLHFNFFDKNVNLVDNAGELLLIHAARPGLDQPARGGYLVHRVDLDAGNVMPMQELGGNALFVGDS
uniref:KIB1-4 beta-propeller domain-containing protein n=1 Tax=Aegilops tauschii TaxID=37682 RepID=N1R5G0_AEGTA